jgi:pimeloyl-ACP methyl ester carboxylesterase
MKRAIALIVLAAIVVVACGDQAPSAPTSVNGSALVACGTAGDQGQGGGAPNGSPLDFGAAAPMHRFCMHLVLSWTKGWSQEVQVVAYSSKASDPLVGRKLLVYQLGGPGLSTAPLASGDAIDVDPSTYTVLTWYGTISGNGGGACGPESTKYLEDRRPADFEVAAKKAAAECLPSAAFGSPSDIGAWAAADELEHIRAALGVDQFDMLMFSYGTAIAQTYLQVHPEHIRRAVLDAPLGMDVAWTDRVAAVGTALEADSNALAMACDGEACRAALKGVDPSRAYDTLRQAVLARQPLIGSSTLVLTGTMFDVASELALRSHDSWLGWSQAVEQALAGDGSMLWRVGENIYAGLDWPVFYRSICADIAHPDSAAGYRIGDKPLLFAYTSELAPCAWFPAGVPRVAAPGAASGPGSHPSMLVVASAADPVAPVAIVDASPFLRTGVLCSTNVVGHTSFGDPDVKKAVIAFLSDGTGADAAACQAGR